MKSLILTLGLVACLFTGCTLPSTRMAQDGSFASQAVNDGVHYDMFNALARENYEVAKLQSALDVETAKNSPDPKAATEALKTKFEANLKAFAKKRDAMVSWDRDHERANAYKYVTVDAKLFSEQGILNYIGKRISTGAKKLLDAWDASKAVWTDNLAPPVSPTTQPSAY